MRVDGKFVDAAGEVPPEGQFVRSVSRICADLRGRELGLTCCSQSFCGFHRAYSTSSDDVTVSSTSSSAHRSPSLRSSCQSSVSKSTGDQSTHSDGSSASPCRPTSCRRSRSASTKFSSTGGRSRRATCTRTTWRSTRLITFARMASSTARTAATVFRKARPF